MNDPGEAPAIVAQGALGAMRELKQHLATDGIEAQLVQPPEGKGSS